jgi:hypothetical protein
MKFRRENKADFYFSDLEEFVITTPNGFTLTGKSVDDILHMWTQPSAQAYAVTTRSGSKRQRINDRLALAMKIVMKILHLKYLISQSEIENY